MTWPTPVTLWRWCATSAPRRSPTSVVPCCTRSRRRWSTASTCGAVPPNGSTSRGRRRPPSWSPPDPLPLLRAQRSGAREALGCWRRGPGRAVVAGAVLAGRSSRGGPRGAVVAGAVVAGAGRDCAAVAPARVAPPGASSGAGEVLAFVTATVELREHLEQALAPVLAVGHDDPTGKGLLEMLAQLYGGSYE